MHALEWRSTRCAGARSGSFPICAPIVQTCRASIPRAFRSNTNERDAEGRARYVRD